MDLHAAKILATDLIRQHGLLGWSFRFDRARRRFGSCRVRARLITLSRPLTLLNSDAQVRDTILHEIAHALAPKDGHGARWKAACRKLGAKPVRCFNDKEVVAPARKPARYQIGCGRCGWWAQRRRLNARPLVCRSCRDQVIYRDTITGRQFRIAIVQRRRVIVGVG